MSEACVALPTDLLSAYVDEELNDGELLEVEAHLAACPHCRRQLDSLARVTGTLRNLERVAPPPALEEMVLGRLEVPGARSWSRRMDDFMSKQQRTRSTVGPLFALVMMLVLLVFLFMDALVRKQRGPRVISVPSQVATGAPNEAVAAQAVIEDPASGQRYVRVTPVAELAAFRDRFAVTTLWLNEAFPGGPERAATLSAIDVCPSASSVSFEAPFLRELSGLEERSAVVYRTAAGEWLCALTGSPHSLAEPRD